MTPWGGEALSQQFQKGAPPQTGESLELSFLPGLESRDSQGRTLGELRELYGSKLMGSAVTSPQPLLIKLIDAKDILSVQVHPDDQAAMEYHGKQGKSEGWVVLDALPGARLVMGLQKGVTAGDLAESAKAGAGMEALLRSLEVSPGDAYYIPAGTVHALGAGMLVYEIQQSSDVTYRLYDWGRLGKDGRGRELHLEAAFKVLNPESRPETQEPMALISCKNGRLSRLMCTPFFTLDELRGCQGFLLEPEPARFSALTALSACSLQWEGGELALAPGHSAFLPADTYPLRVFGEHVLLAKPGD